MSLWCPMKALPRRRRFVEVETAWALPRHTSKNREVGRRGVQVGIYGRVFTTQNGPFLDFVRHVRYRVIFGGVLIFWKTEILKICGAHKTHGEGRSFSTCYEKHEMQMMSCQNFRFSEFQVFLECPHFSFGKLEVLVYICSIVMTSKNRPCHERQVKKNIVSGFQFFWIHHKLLWMKLLISNKITVDIVKKIDKIRASWPSWST